MKNQSISPLKLIPYGNASIIRGYNDDNLPVERLLSYNTIAAEIIGGWLRVYGLYSATTRKHISAFMRECTKDFTYYTAKACYENKYMLNIYTGEVISLED